MNAMVVDSLRIHAMSVMEQVSMEPILTVLAVLALIAMEPDSIVKHAITVMVLEHANTTALIATATVHIAEMATTLLSGVLPYSMSYPRTSSMLSTT